MGYLSNKIGITKWITRQICVLFLLILGCTPDLFSQTDTLKIIGEKLPNGDTATAINILHKLAWDVDVITKQHKLISYQHILKADTLLTSSYFRKLDIDTLYLTANFLVSPGLRYINYDLYYDVTGSLNVSQNGINMLQTGDFQISKKSELKSTSQEDYTSFSFIDSIQHWRVTYIPQARTGKIKLDKFQFFQSQTANEKKKAKINDVNDSYRVGFYYLAFGIVFLILFAFFRKNNEFLYFSLFCIFVALATLWSNVKIEYLEDASVFLGLLWMEFLTLFFAKVIKNKERSKIPLLIIVGIGLISLLPIIRYSNDFYTGYKGDLFSINNSDFPVAIVVIVILMVIYEFIACLYFLIAGLKQKSWEARAILYICTAPLLLIVVFIVIFIIIMIVVSMFTKFGAENAGQTQLGFVFGFAMVFLGKIIVYGYPLSAVLILARRNSLNQKQLAVQVEAIKKLSDENLAKEQEKQLILENQNMELEKKVLERTEEVVMQKNLVEIKNKAITDNLNYAQRIQSAILPDINLIYRSLEQSFILYMPKDIVSGDFYAFAEQDDKVLIIAGDCTGHGVSGAFMSMIGSSLLNQIINENGVTDPALILNRLNIAIIDTFRQGESENNDGMDISICSLDIKHHIMKYAGANRPLWLIRKEELITLKPDKFPVGGVQMARNRTFTNLTVPLEKNDTIYIFTDGFADQFGGVAGKKLMTAKFRELLLNIQLVPMREQEITLRNYFEDWRGIQEQVDDVLIIGIRV